MVDGTLLRGRLHLGVHRRVPWGDWDENDNNPLLIVGIVLAVIVFVISWIVFLAGEKHEAISEWSTH